MWQSAMETHLAIFQLEFELNLGAIHGLVDEFGGYPSLGGIGLPRSRADIVSRCHGGGGLARRRGIGGRLQESGGRTKRRRTRPDGGRHSFAGGSGKKRGRLKGEGVEEVSETIRVAVWGCVGVWRR